MSRMNGMRISLRSHSDNSSNNVIIKEGRESVILNCKDTDTSITFDEDGLYDLIIALQLVYKRI